MTQSQYKIYPKPFEKTNTPVKEWRIWRGTAKRKRKLPNRLHPVTIPKRKRKKGREKRKTVVMISRVWSCTSMETWRHSKCIFECNPCGFRDFSDSAGPAGLPLLLQYPDYFFLMLARGGGGEFHSTM
jgi:hypothetical protein